MGTKANLNIDQGSDFITSVTLTDDDGTALSLTGYTGESHIRKYYTSTTYNSFTVTIEADTGTVQLELDAATSNAMDHGRYLYDVELTYTSDGTISRIMEGIVTINPGVTR
mgnify:CR=1 FL=1